MPNAGCLTKRNALQKQILALSTRIRFRLKRHLSLCGLAFRPRVSGENGDQKRNFSKTLSKVEIKKKPFSCFRLDGENGTFPKR